jgi:hypothetical protein
MTDFAFPQADEKETGADSRADAQSIGEKVSKITSAAEKGLMQLVKCAVGKQDQ